MPFLLFAWGSLGFVEIQTDLVRKTVVPIFYFVDVMTTFFKGELFHWQKGG